MNRASHFMIHETFHIHFVDRREGKERGAGSETILGGNIIGEKRVCGGKDNISKVCGF